MLNEWISVAAKKRHLAHTREAARLLGVEVESRRKERRWTEAELAERAGISRTTLWKVERGDTTVALGTVFDVATLVGVTLFHDTVADVASARQRVSDRLELLPDRIRVSAREVNDDF
ncbi:MAG: helix-turn-helix domain-containing protein [Thermoleophilia bacterium]|nr:helix-turn-helix domain-containing protein [Thermoleophilia bacterium]